jgi:hypothetical protein
MNQKGNAGLDFFAGSGTTGMAAALGGRRFIVAHVYCVGRHKTAFGFRTVAVVYDRRWRAVVLSHVRGASSTCDQFPPIHLC